MKDIKLCRFYKSNKGNGYIIFFERKENDVFYYLRISSDMRFVCSSGKRERILEILEEYNIEYFDNRLLQLSIMYFFEIEFSIIKWIF